MPKCQHVIKMIAENKLRAGDSILLIERLRFTFTPNVNLYNVSKLFP